MRVHLLQIHRHVVEIDMLICHVAETEDRLQFLRRPSVEHERFTARCHWTIHNPVLGLTEEAFPFQVFACKTDMYAVVQSACFFFAMDSQQAVGEQHFLGSNKGFRNINCSEAHARTNVNLSWGYRSDTINVHLYPQRLNSLPFGSSGKRGQHSVSS